MMSDIRFAQQLQQRGDRRFTAPVVTLRGVRGVFAFAGRAQRRIVQDCNETNARDDIPFLLSRHSEHGADAHVLKI